MLSSAIAIAAAAMLPSPLASAVKHTTWRMLLRPRHRGVEKLVGMISQPAIQPACSRGAAARRSRLVNANYRRTYSTATTYIDRAGSSQRGYEMPHLPNLEKQDAELGAATSRAGAVEHVDVFEITDVRDAKAAVAVLKQHNDLMHACDTEVAGLDLKRSPIGQGQVICISIYSGPDIDFGHGKGQALWIDTTRSEVMDEFREWLNDENALKVWHNYGFDRHVLWNHGVDVRGFGADTMHMARLWDASRMNGYSLEQLTDELVGRRKIPMKEIFGVPSKKKDGTAGRTIVLPPVDELQTSPMTRGEWIKYSVYDAQGTWLLYQELRKKLEETDWEEGHNMYDFYTEYWRPFGELLTDIERAGVHVDIKKKLPSAQLQAMADRDQAELAFRRWAASFCADAWYMNVGSASQVQALLFGGAAASAKSNERLPLSRAFKVLRDDYEMWSAAAVGEQDEEVFASGVGLQPVEAKPAAKSRKKETPAATALEGEPVDGQACAEAGPGSEAAAEAKAEAAVPAIRAPKALKNVEITLKSIGLKHTKVTPKGLPATDAASLRELAGFPNDSPPRFGAAYEAFHGGEAGERACRALDSLCAANAIETMLSTFIMPLQEFASPGSRIHCSLNLNTETGRLSARAPNLQNQPALEKDKYRVRDAFTAVDKCTLVVADYGQLELRLLAHMTKCKSMIDAFEKGGCFHSRTAMGMFQHVREAVDRGDCLLEWDYSKGAPPAPLLKDVFGSERRKAKTLNFSIAYGKTPHGLAKDWGVSIAEAKAMLQAWYADRPEVLAWQEKTKADARKTGYTRTLMGRRRPLVGIATGKMNMRSHLERAAINTPIQGGAADIMTLAMLKLKKSEKLKELGYTLILQVHDEVMLEGPEESGEEAMKEVVACMREPFDKHLPSLLVELAVDAKCARTWFEAK
uniref:DNA-directed DNA polymerase family A palm domain-containing protein n=1 Tax=Chrysotila carterae TaxID=13221 RepID=A0A7S4EZM0_CHRCT|mmetsp:Transcript_43081/g.89992  ORF Transcript_43081/g.89992 Transcript_43081/m.89992 type:complete len:919 (-) Transcript_43081:51-2807(-)